MTNAASKPSDLEIVRWILEGDINAFETLVVRYEGDVFRIVRRHVPANEVEETAQDVFIRAFQALATFQARSNFKNWLSAIAVRTCHDYWRRVYRSKEIPMSSLSARHQDWIEEVLSEQSVHSGEELGSRQEAREFLEWALGMLTPEDRMVLELVYLEGLSGKEVADLLGWSVANVKVRSFRSRRKLERMVRKGSKFGQHLGKK
jgi:RNA polymerase sigma-70 factor (ECF subfamily)